MLLIFSTLTDVHRCHSLVYPFEILFCLQKDSKEDDEKDEEQKVKEVPLSASLFTNFMALLRCILLT